jgi:protein-tyrosine phosphatase
MAYVDLHCHILPGLDDGARTMEETLRYARRLDAEGVHDVACTPHIKRSDFPHIDVRALGALRARAQDEIDAEGLRVRLHPGGELAHEDALVLDDEELALIAQGPEHAPWLLLECPFEGLGDEFDDAVERLDGLGYGLLLAHPERVFGELDRLRPHVEAGALLQVNVSSLCGDHGRLAQERAARLVKRGLAYCLASDTHPGTRERTLPLARDALRRLGVSEVQALRLVQSNPRFLLREGDPRLEGPRTSVDSGYGRSHVMKTRDRWTGGYRRSSTG